MLEKCHSACVVSWLQNLDTSSLDGCTTTATILPTRPPSQTGFPTEHPSSPWHDCSAMEGSEDAASVTSNPTSQPTLRTLRHVLIPTPPSSKRGAKGARSPSPTRKAIALLERASPSIRFCQPGKAVIQPPEVVLLRRFLGADVGIQVIPLAFEAGVSLFISLRHCADSSIVGSPSSGGSRRFRRHSTNDVRQRTN